MPQLTVATCQFPVSADVARNARFVLRQMRAAKRRGAHVAHFCEAALSGYAGVDRPSFEGFDWDAQTAGLLAVMVAARKLGLWVVVGGAHRLSGGHKPHNSLYWIDSEGRLVDRYDKRFCAGDRAGRTGDLAHYTPGDHFTVVSIRDVACGALVCHDLRYPELYRQYKRLGARVVFHAYHAGGAAPERYRELRAYVGAEGARLSGGETLPGITMPATMVAAATNNYMWISCANSSARESCWPAFAVRPDGVVAGRLRRNTAGVLITEIDTERDLYDSTAAWRDRAIDGVLHSGEPVEDPRSRDRRAL